jgi:nucleoid DNA-binding protein
MAVDKKSTKDKKALSKAQLLAHLAEKTELTRKQVEAVFSTLQEVIHSQLGKKGPGTFTLPGLLKLKVIHKKATKERIGENPFKPGEKMVYKAKPARNQVKAYVLKAFSSEVK